MDQAALDEVLGRLHQAGVRTLTCRLPTLEELFLRHYSAERSVAGAPRMTVLAHPGRAGTGLTGTGELARLAVRRDRIGLAAAVYVITAGVAGTAWALKRLYPTPAGRAALAATAGANPALRFLYGRLDGTSLGSITTWRYGVWAGLFAALVAIFVVIRHTRTDEEAGRLELVGSAVVGRQAALVAALATAAAGVLAVSVLLCAVLPLTGLPAAGSALLALGIGCCGLAFTGIAAVAAQLTSAARAARGIALGVLGVAFVLRGVGDSAGASGPSWLSWASPLAWIQLARPFAASDPWVLALPLAVGAAGTGLAFALAARRDQGAGLLPDRPGRATASAVLRGPFGLAWRLQRGALAGWVTGYAFLFAICGAAAKGIGQLFGTSTALEREFTRLGGQAAITNAYLAALMLLAGLVAAAYAISVILRLRAEETGRRPSWCWPRRPAGSAGRSATSPSPSAAPRCCWPSRGWRPAWATGCGSGPRGRGWPG